MNTKSTSIDTLLNSFIVDRMEVKDDIWDGMIADVNSLSNIEEHIKYNSPHLNSLITRGWYIIDAILRDCKAEHLTSTTAMIIDNGIDKQTGPNPIPKMSFVIAHADELPILTLTASMTTFGKNDRVNRSMFTLRDTVACEILAVLDSHPGLGALHNCHPYVVEKVVEAFSTYAYIYAGGYRGIRNGKTGNLDIVFPIVGLSHDSDDTVGFAYTLSINESVYSCELDTALPLIK